jgi:hypothetical protein
MRNPAVYSLVRLSETLSVDRKYPGETSGGVQRIQQISHDVLQVQQGTAVVGVTDDRGESSGRRVDDQIGHDSDALAAIANFG